MNGSSTSVAISMSAPALPSVSTRQTTIAPAQRKFLCGRKYRIGNTITGVIESPRKSN